MITRIIIEDNMANKGPKTYQGAIRKALTGDGRKNLDTSVSETLFGKKKKNDKSPFGSMLKSPFETDSKKKTKK